MVGARIKQLREAKGLHQKELGEIVGVTDPMITMIERGTRQVSAPLLGDLAKTLGCTTDWLVYGDER